MVRVPPSGMASRALTARFSRICSVCPRSARMAGRASAGPHDEVDLLADAAGQQLPDLLDHRVEVEHLRTHRLAPGEHQQLPGQTRGPLRRGEDLLDVELHVDVVGHRLAHERGVVEDDRQQVVEVVGHAPGQLAQAFEPLGLVEALLQRPPLDLGRLAGGDVADEPGERLGTGKVDAVDRHLGREERPVRSHRRQLRAAAEQTSFARGEEALEALIVGMALVGGDDDLRQLAADHVDRRHAERALGGGVELLDLALRCSW